MAEQVESAKYPLADGADLDETVALVEKTGRRIVAVKADVRSQAQLDAAVAEGIAAFGHIDIVCANAGIAAFGATCELSDEPWQDVIDINLTGCAYRRGPSCPDDRSQTRRVGHHHHSVAGLKGIANIAHYTAAKHGRVGLVRTLANELAPHDIRVNLVCPTGVSSPMMLNDWSRRLFRPDLEHPTDDDVAEVLGDHHVLDTPWVTPSDVSHAVLFLASDEARYVTGAALPVDAGALVK